MPDPSEARRTTPLRVPATAWRAFLIAALVAMIALPAGATHDVSAPDLVFAPVTACRVVDTRLTSSGPLVPNVVRTFVFRGPTTDFSSQGGSPIGCGVPGLSGGDPQHNLAKVLMLNITAKTPKGLKRGSLKAWPANAAQPAVSLLYFPDGGTSFGISNGITVQMCDEDATNPCQTGDIALIADRRVHVIVDVHGYFH